MWMTSSQRIRLKWDPPATDFTPVFFPHEGSRTSHIFSHLELHTTAQGIFINQHKYTKDLIAFARHETLAIVDTLLEVNVKYQRDEGELLSDPTINRRFVGSELYLTIT